jgi:tetratricopeptide (TPR) repeat protein
MNRIVRVSSALLLWACLGVAAYAENVAPRDIWPQATAAADTGDFDTAYKKTTDLTDLGSKYGIKTYPVYASSAVALSRQAVKNGNTFAVDFGNKAADQLDANSAAVALAKADAAADRRDWAHAVPAAFKGLARTFNTYRGRLLSRFDFLIVIIAAVLLTAIAFAVALFIRYGRSMAHDFREILGSRVSGGSVTVLAFALLFLPLFVWLGPVWLIFYWLIIFFGYAKLTERILIVIFGLLIAAAPIALDMAASRIAGVDSPVVLAALATEEQSYYPEALRRMQDLLAVVPDNDTLHILAGNLLLHEGDEQQAAIHYRRAAELHDTAGVHVNLGNLNFLSNDYAAAITEYTKAEQLDAKLAIAFYNHSVASGETYKFDDQAKNLDQAKRIDRAGIEAISSNPPTQKIVMYRPPIAQAWTVATSIARRGAARALFGNYAWFDPMISARNPLTLGGILVAIGAPILFFRRRRAGFAGSCIKCGRTYCYRCKSGRESATYCTQCIHIYLKRDGVSLETKRLKLEEVSDHHNALVRRNKLFATFMPGSAQLLEGRTAMGVLGLFAFMFFVCMAIFVGRLAPVLGSGELAKMIVRAIAILVAVVIWFFLSLPVYRRRAAVA